LMTNGGGLRVTLAKFGFSLTLFPAREATGQENERKSKRPPRNGTRKTKRPNFHASG
jgi:hypothetical protein